MILKRHLLGECHDPLLLKFEAVRHKNIHNIYLIGAGRDEWHSNSIKKYIALDSSSKEAIKSAVKGKKCGFCSKMNE